MKKFYFTTIVLLFWVVAQAQIVNIPDANFKAKLIALGVDTSGDGNIQNTEALAITNLNVSNSSIYSLQGISNFINLNSLNCENNLLSTLNVNGLNNLNGLSCYNNNLTNLSINGLTYLQTVFCSGNQLISLDIIGCPNLVSLSCESNQLSSLNVSGLIGLRTLFCYNNQLTSLNLGGLSNLKDVICRNNLLQFLNLQGSNNLQTIFTRENQITNLDLSGLTNLLNIDCSYNLIQSLDLADSNNLTKLICNDNQLSTLFIKNNNQIWNDLSFFNNPNLDYICANEDDLVIVQDKVNSYGYTNCNVNSYCSFAPGGTYYNILGVSTIDFNNDGCDSTDLKYSNLRYNISDGTNSGIFIANNSGNYNIPVQTGTHLMSPQLENPSYFNVSPANVSVTFPATASPFTQDFCITPNGVHHDLEVVIIPPGNALPGFDAKYKIKYKNKGNQSENVTINFDFDDSISNYISASVMPTLQSTGNLSWSIGTLLPFAYGEIIVTLNLNSPMETPPLNAGTIIQYTVLCNGLNVDETIDDNKSRIYQTLVNSYDPNDKNCLEGNTINPAMIGEYVHYMIRFENTGTFAAQNVVVKDMIDTTKFEISTLQITEASHSCVTKISDTNKVEFIFENINLPFDNATNDGYVVFKIKTKSNLVVGNTISNSANIYFDYNFPIVTNTATSSFQTPLQNDTFVFENYFSIYPNPANDVLNITSKLTSEIYSLSIYNVLGQLVQTTTRPTKTVDVSGLKTGNYILKVNSENGISSSKFTKL